MAWTPALRMDGQWWISPLRFGTKPEATDYAAELAYRIERAASFSPDAGIRSRAEHISGSINARYDAGLLHMVNRDGTTGPCPHNGLGC